MFRACAESASSISPPASKVRVRTKVEMVRRVTRVICYMFTRPGLKCASGGNSAAYVNECFRFVKRSFLSEIRWPHLPSGPSIRVRVRVRVGPIFVPDGLRRLHQHHHSEFPWPIGVESVTL